MSFDLGKHKIGSKILYDTTEQYSSIYSKFMSRFMLIDMNQYPLVRQMMKISLIQFYLLNPCFVFSFIFFI